MKIFKTLSSILVTSVLSVTVIPSTFASTESTATNQTQQTVLFDNSHAQTAGAADWVIDGAFSDYADSMRKQGYQVKELEGESNISDQSLQQAHVLVIPEANNPFKENEQKAIINFVKNGGSVIFISDHYNADRNLNRIDSSESMNGYRRGAYQNMTKDMNNEEKILTLCITLRVLIGSHKTSVFVLDIMHLEISILKISFQAKIVLVLLKVYTQFQCTQVQH